MAAFQIHDADGKAIDINVLDQEAAAFWGKEVHPKDYANPSEPRKEGESDADYYRRSMTGNWFYVIGHQIAYQGTWTSGWANVYHTMISSSLGRIFLPKGNELISTDWLQQAQELSPDGSTVIPKVHLKDSFESEIYGTLLFYKPYVELMNHWQTKGYKPVKIEE